MIKKTFYSLDPDKKQRIIDSARTEFSLYPLGSAKISRIITAADIPRGSFYQYFDGLDDVLEAFIEEIKKEKAADFSQLMVESAEDIFHFAELIFASELKYFSSEKNTMLVENVLTHGSISLNPAQVSSSDALHPQASTLLAFTKDLRISTEEELKSLFKLILTCISENIRSALSDETSNIDPVVEFKRQLDFIKIGAVKRKDT